LNPDQNTTKSSFLAQGLHFDVERKGDQVWHRQARLDEGGRPIYEVAMEAHFAVGSGQRGHSYLTVEDGYVFQTPISWFSRTGAWDISPGFVHPVRRRPVPQQCLYCHANRVDPWEGSVNRYQVPL